MGLRTGGIVEVRDDIDDRAGGQFDRFLEVIGALPGRVPVVDLDEALGRAVAVTDRHMHVVAELVHVGGDGQGFAGQPARTSSP